MGQDLLWNLCFRKFYGNKKPESCLGVLFNIYIYISYGYLYNVAGDVHKL